MPWGFEVKRSDFVRSKFLRDLRADLVNQAIRDGVVVDGDYYDALTRAIHVLEELQGFVHHLDYELRGS